MSHNDTVNISNPTLTSLSLDMVPSYTRKLFCTNTKLKKLPTNLPDGIETIICQNGILEWLPWNKLPNSLVILNCTALRGLYSRHGKNIKLIFVARVEAAQRPCR
jgi:hypothetical protein